MVSPAGQESVPSFAKKLEEGPFTFFFPPQIEAD